MVFIESAFLGDERAMRDVTKILNDKIVGTSISVPVDDKLIPPFVVAEKTEITSAEEKAIRKKAEELCGGPDQVCLDAKMAELRQQALVAKSSLANSSANVIKGRRLTVNVLTEKGQRKRLVIPDGNKFELDGLTPRDPRKPDQTLPSFDFIKGTFIDFVGTAAITFTWVFGIVATYAIFSRLGWGYIAIAMAFVAFILPGSGYVMILGYFIMESFVSNYTTML